MFGFYLRSLTRNVVPRLCRDGLQPPRMFLSSSQGQTGNTVVATVAASMPVFAPAEKLYRETNEPDTLLRRLEVEVKGHDSAVINSYEQFVRIVCEELGLNLVSVLTPPTAHERRSVLKSIHVHKIHRVQYEMRTHYRVFQLKHLTGSTADTFLEYIQRNLPEGIAMKVTKSRIERLPEHIKPPANMVPTKEPDYETDPNEHFPSADENTTNQK